jgi:hypothetical protein
LRRRQGKSMETGYLTAIARAFSERRQSVHPICKEQTGDIVPLLYCLEATCFNLSIQPSLLSG